LIEIKQFHSLGGNVRQISWCPSSFNQSFNRVLDFRFVVFLDANLYKVVWTIRFVYRYILKSICTTIMSTTKRYVIYANNGGSKGINELLKLTRINARQCYLR